MNPTNARSFSGGGFSETILQFFRNITMIEKTL
jgi:hypothetical protein